MLPQEYLAPKYHGIGVVRLLSIWAKGVVAQPLLFFFFFFFFFFLKKYFLIIFFYRIYKDIFVLLKN
jgi:hypothetical protein